jgi:4'-phosphopantetheinyl transferase
MQHMDRQALIADLADNAHVRILRTDTVTDPDKLAESAALLSPDETARFNRFRFDADRRLYLLSHAMLRRALSAYTGVEPAAWAFSPTVTGRPEIASPDPGLPLRFNLTHTRGLAACVVTHRVDCGVDAEQLSVRRHARDIAARMFAAEELEVLSRLQGQAFLEQFYACWTLREAYCKARGVGLAGSGKHFRFERVARGAWRLHHGDQGSSSGGHWQLAVEQVPADYMVAVAVNAAAAGIRVLEFDF